MAITGEGTYIDYHYTGGIQTFTVPITGLYQFEVWGAQGGSGDYGGGSGGWSFGYKVLTKGQVLYIVCGGAGIRSTYGQTAAGGYNGGGGVKSAVGYDGYVVTPGTGGGATHIATRSGTLASLVNYKSDVLIVAGGGGGGGSKGSYGGGGGTGGGVSGGTGGGTYGATGGTQSAGGKNSAYAVSAGTFGAAATDIGNAEANGGGGWYGGGRAYGLSGGGGGSGYIGGVPAITYSGTYYTPGMVNGNRAGNGMARIKLVKVQSNLKFNNITMEKVYFNNTKIEKVIYNGTTVFG